MKVNIHHFFYSLFILLLPCVNAYSQDKNQFAPFTLYGKILLDEKPVENVTLELLKNDQLLKKIVTTKNGKYTFVMQQDTSNQQNEYIIHVSKEGTVPKTLVVNTFIPGSEYDYNNFDYLLEINLVPTTINDIVLQRPSAKIKWNTSESNYGIDQVYAKIVQKEEEKLKEDPDTYLKELAERMKKDEEEKKRKAEEEAKKKEEEEARRREEELARKAAEETPVAVNKEEEEAQLTLKENINAIKTKLKELSKAPDSLPVIPSNNKTVKEPAPVVVSKQDTYDDPMQYELKKARVALEKRRLKEEKIKSANLAAKYETSNVMSSLLDAVDEHDKRLKNK